MIVAWCVAALCGCASAAAAVDAATSHVHDVDVDAMGGVGVGVGGVAGDAGPEVFIYDTFLFNGDDVAQDRLRVMAPHVDHIFVIEARVTHVGARKEQLFVDANQSVFAPYAHKVSFVVVEEPPTMDPAFLPYAQQQQPWMLHAVDAWWRESHQRWIAHDAVAGVVATKRVASPSARHVSIMTDCDEIVSPAVLQWLRSRGNVALLDAVGGVAHLTMDFFYYSVRWRFPVKWRNGFLATADALGAASVLDVRRWRDWPKPGTSRAFLSNAGAHMSYFMSVDGILRKLSSFTHQVRRSRC
jgi:hypothetical protein